MTAVQLEQMIEFIGRKRIISADQWKERFARGQLRPDDICFTFDDNLRCQYDVALPILKREQITAFWFVYTAPLCGVYDGLEVYRAFRTARYPNVDDFYESFYKAAAQSPWADKIAARLENFVPSQHLRDFPFYTDADRKFRFVRDDILGVTPYQQVMESMMRAEDFDVAAAARNLWMDAAALQDLRSQGHCIGLHSHTHPTRMGELPAAEQQAEYSRNLSELTQIIGERPSAMSHPCNSFSPATLEILSGLGITLGFRANMALSRPSGLELPREDHANVLAAMRSAK